MSTVVIVSAAVVFAVAAIDPWAAVAAHAQPAGPPSSAIALVSTVAAITLYFAGLERIGPTRASTLSTIEPLVTVTLAALVLDETLTLAQLAGGALILAAVVVLAAAGRRRQT